ncbi:hypothetical protein HJG60_010355 [Phyllostomus discolor]|uniref:Uncharacterized protein n=1 Tax=Phyllostomus discolor TaxID=89673 RepID=A0A834ASS3_9CHIR|nr:hypothetical protein HJG60_010355 [Phyllostomus discolor]
MRKCIRSACIYCLRTATSRQSNVTCLHARKCSWLLNHKDRQQVSYHQLIIQHEGRQQVLSMETRSSLWKTTQTIDPSAYGRRRQSAVADRWPVSKGGTSSTGCKCVYGRSFCTLPFYKFATHNLYVVGDRGIFGL